MASQFVYLQGKAKWCRPHVPNEWGDYTMVLYPDTKSLDLVRDLQAEGVKNVIKKDDEGFHVRLKRPSQKTIKGAVRGFAPPEVFGEDGETPLRNVNIGNGSDVTVKMEVYQHGVPGQPGKKAKAMRWNSVKVDNLVPFDGKRDFTEDEEEASAGLPEQQLAF